MIIHGDCLHALKELPDNYVDSVVTDPPYGLKFMGKKWDYDVPSMAVWNEVRRVLKPGGHLLSFGGTRTFHRLVVSIEDAGFEIRDMIQWLYGSGFPKSLDVSKAIDKAAGHWRGKAGEVANENSAMSGPNYERTPKGDAVTDLAKHWQGWGTALKPANEPICLARKPLEKGLTVAQNVQKWGTGALNIEASRIECESRPARDATAKTTPSQFGAMGGSKAIGETSQGRWPANVILDEEAASGHEWARFFYVAKASKAERNSGLDGMPESRTHSRYGSGLGNAPAIDGIRHSSEKNIHPTVKPIKLMEYLIRMVTPPAGIVLDPFCGSGSTGVAAKRLGFGFIGIEREKEYCEIAEKRMEAVA